MASIPELGVRHAMIGTTMLPSQQVLSPGAGSATNRCCDGGQSVIIDPHTGQAVCSCQYNAAVLACARAPGRTTIGYPFNGLNVFPTSSDPSTLYSSLNPIYKEASDVMRLSLPGGVYSPYDTSLSSYPYATGYGSIDARRKNATRESTNTLKAWLYEHRKNPYPTKGEKIMLAILTKMTLTQVSTWFANARRRLKKDCRSSWDSESKSLDGEDDDDDVIGGDVGDDDVDVGREESDEGTGRRGDNGSTDGNVNSPGREEEKLTDQQMEDDEEDVEVESNEDMGKSKDDDRDVLQQSLPSEDLRKCVNDEAVRTPSEDTTSLADRDSDRASDRTSDQTAHRCCPSQMAGSSTSPFRQPRSSNGGVSKTSGEKPERANENNMAKPKPRIWSIDDVVGTNSSSNRCSSATTRPKISDERQRSWAETSRPAIVTAASPLARQAPEVPSLPLPPTHYGPPGFESAKLTWAMDASRCLHPYFSSGFSLPVSHPLTPPGVAGLPHLPFMPMMNGGFLPRTVDAHGLRHSLVSSGAPLSRDALGLAERRSPERHRQTPLHDDSQRPTYGSESNIRTC